MIQFAMKHALFWFLGMAFLAGAQALQPHNVLDSQLQPRDTVTTLHAPLSLSSQTWSGIDGQWTSYNLRLGSPQFQNVLVIPSTKATTVYAIDPEWCATNRFLNGTEEDCISNRGGVFNSNASSDWLDASFYWIGIDNNLGYNAKGSYGNGQVGIGYGNAGPSVQHQFMATVANSNWWFGVFPLNPRPTNRSDTNTPENSLLQSLKDSNNTPSLSWGYTSGAKYRSETFYGSLTLGGYDSARFDNSSQITVPFRQDDDRDLMIRVNEIKTNDSANPISSTPLDLVIDSTVPYLYLPQEVCQAFEKTFGLEWNSTVELYTMSDSQYSTLVERNTGIDFNVGPSNNTTTIHFPIKAFLPQANFPLIPDNKTTYYFPIKKANSSDKHTLGRTFLQEAYITYHYERGYFNIAPCVWPNDTSRPPSSAIVPITNGNSDSNPDDNGQHSISTGAITGAVVGGIIAGLLLAALIAYIWLRRRRHAQQRAQFLKAASSVTHTRSSSSATLPGGRPRAGSRLASFFRNPWGSVSDGDGIVPGHYELPVDPMGLTPAEQEVAAREREHKRHLSNELDAEVSAVHEMYQPKLAVPEMPGDEPFPTYVSGDGATIEGNALRAAQLERERAREEARRAVYEMDATAGLSSASTPLPSPPMPSPGQIDAIARKERDERERLEAERAEAERIRSRELERRVSDGSADVSTDGTARPDTERRVSDLSPISENSAFGGSPTSPSRPYTGSRRVSRD